MMLDSTRNDLKGHEKRFIFYLFESNYDNLKFGFSFINLEI